jgi:hypothetical protein
MSDCHNKHCVNYCEEYEDNCQHWNAGDDCTDEEKQKTYTAKDLNDRLDKIWANITEEAFYSENQEQDAIELAYVKEIINKQRVE